MSAPGTLLAGTRTLLLAALAWSSPCLAQTRGAPDAVDLALSWARGGYASPVVCRFADRAQRGLRRVLIAPGPRTSELRVDRVQFFDLGADGAERCHDELGGEEPNVIGTLYVTYTAKRPRSDTPDRDLQQDLARGPIEFAVDRGRLRIGPAATAPEALRDVDFARGTLRLGRIEPGSDEARRVADLPGARSLWLEALAADGTRVALPLVEVERR
jgi:hypothetical protein